MHVCVWCVCLCGCYCVWMLLPQRIGGVRGTWGVMLTFHLVFRWDSFMGHTKLAGPQLPGVLLSPSSHLTIGAPWLQTCTAVPGFNLGIQGEVLEFVQRELYHRVIPPALVTFESVTICTRFLQNPVLLEVIKTPRAKNMHRAQAH